MADPTQTVSLDSTIAALQQDLTTIAPNDAIALIDGWQQQLQGTDLAEDLGELKQALMSGDTGAISSILSDLGEDTSEAATSADSGVASKVQQLGQLLSQAATSIT